MNNVYFSILEDNVRLYRNLLRVQKTFPENGNLRNSKVVREAFEVRRDETNKQKILQYQNEGKSAAETLQKLSKLFQINPDIGKTST